MLFTKLKLLVPERIKIQIIYLRYKYCNRKAHNIIFHDSSSKLVLLLSPSYSNLGDVAIYLYTLKYLKSINKTLKVSIDSKTCVRKRLLKKYITKSDIILLQGGGNLGDRYVTEELLRANIVKWFPQNKIVCLPQTISYGYSKSNYILDYSIKSYSSHKNIFFCCRDIISLQFAKDFFNKNNSYLIPDIVLSGNVDRVINYEKNKTVLLCLRNDIEISDNHLSEECIISMLNNRYIINHFDTDDYSGNDIIDKEMAIVNILCLFQQFEFVITDRFHGLIFSYITLTPCIVLPTNDHKIREGIKWFEGCNFIFYAEDKEHIKSALKIIQNLSSFKTVDFTKYFHKIKDMLI